MAILQSKSSPSTENAAAMHAQLDAIATLAKRIEAGGPERSKERHLKRGKLLPRDRVNGVLDANSSFLEVGLFAAHGCYESEVPAAGVIAGIGQIHGRDCMIVCNDATVAGGSYYPLTVSKHLRAQEMSRRGLSRKRTLWSNFL